MSLNVELLEQSFGQIKPYFEEFGSSFYLMLFADYPAIEPLFAHTNMPKQRKMLFAALTLVMENLRNPEIIEGALKGLGTRHLQYGAVPEYYPQFGRTLLKALASFLKDDWTPEIRQAWVDAYVALTRLMLEGANYDESVIQLETTSPLLTDA